MRTTPGFLQPRPRGVISWSWLLRVALFRIQCDFANELAGITCRLHRPRTASITSKYLHTGRKTHMLLSPEDLAGKPFEFETQQAKSELAAGEID